MPKTGKILRSYEGVSRETGLYKVEIWSPPIVEVDLLDWSKNAERTIALTTQGYSGIYDTRVYKQQAESTAEQTLNLLYDVRNTKLSTPLEMVYFTFLFRNVSRAWTHQAVRYRIGTAYVQESMRFLGYSRVYKVLATKPFTKPELDAYGDTCFQAIRTYVQMKDVGVDDQDARGTLPTNITTSLFWSMSLKTLVNIYRTRWCCQAQHPEWLPALQQIKMLVGEKVSDVLAELFIRAPIDDGQPCGFNASFDRPCTWTASNQGEENE